MFFATTSGPYTESVLPFLNLLDVLTVNNVYCLHALTFSHLWHKGHLPSLLDNLFQYASCRHTHNTRYASKQNLSKPLPRTNTGKQMFSYQAIDLWCDIPYYLKDLSIFSFAKEIKHYLLSEQYSKKNCNGNLSFITTSFKKHYLFSFIVALFFISMVIGANSEFLRFLWPLGSSF